MSFYKKMFADFEEMYYMHATLGIILSSCLGAGAAMLVLVTGHGFSQMVQVFLLTAVCMGFNTTVLAGLKPKIVFNSLLISLALSTILIIYHVICM